MTFPLALFVYHFIVKELLVSFAKLNRSFYPLNSNESVVADYTLFAVKSLSAFEKSK